MKRCFMCRLSKPLEAFQRNASTRDGFQAACAACWNLYTGARSNGYDPQDWRQLAAYYDRMRERRGRTVFRCAWQCDHMQGDREKTYNGVGLRRVTPVPLNGYRRAWGDTGKLWPAASA